MAPPSKRKPMKIDEEKSTLWAISSLASVGVGVVVVGVSLSTFDLVNRQTGRAHRLVLKSGGAGAGLPVSGSFDSSPYGTFTTSRPVNFRDFDGIWMEVGEVNLGVYSWNEVTLRDGPTPTKPILGKTKMRGLGLGIPGIGKQHGITEVLFSDGRPVDPGGVMMEVRPPATNEEGGMKGQDHAQNAYRIPSDALFGFNQDNISQVAAWVLRDAGDYIKQYKGPGSKIYITGHTDSIGDPTYNQGLSMRRAKAVAKWLIDEKYVSAAEVITSGEGASKPVEPNKRPDGKDNPYGREKNRRVEIMIM